MTNEEIILSEAIKIYGEDKVQEMINNGEEIPLHTYQGWMERGPYRVKKGEHGIETRLWKRKKKDENKDGNYEEQESLIPSNRDFFLAKAFLFKMEQVEKISL